MAITNAIENPIIILLKGLLCRFILITCKSFNAYNDETIKDMIIKITKNFIESSSYNSNLYFINIS